MAVRRKQKARRSTLATRFKKDPISTTTAEGKKLGIPKPVMKLALIGIGAGLLTPKLAGELNRIPFMSVFTGYGLELKRKLSGMKGR
tara:strand:+ start:122 stop:382 length:261 start_codon:yes stop_codon:yes gene_type:complete